MVAQRELSGQWAAITGGSKGIGYGIARGFVADGASVLLAARGREALEKAQAELREIAQPDQSVEIKVLDTENGQSIDAFFDEVRAEIPDLDIFVANAGAGTMVPFLDITPETWQWVTNLNLTGTFRTVQGAARLMRDGASANRSIIVVSSIRALGARPGVLPYAVTKAGLNQLVRVAAYELAEHDIRVNALSPGITATPLSDQNPDVFARMVKTVPMRRAGSPKDMAEAACYLARPGSAFVTGTNLIVDGGEHLW